MTRHPLADAIATPITPTTTSVVTPQTSAASAHDDGPTVVSQAAMLATVASDTQPRWSPVAPSMSTLSTKPSAGKRSVCTKVAHRAMRSTTIPTTVRTSVANWASTSQVPLSTAVAAIHQPTAR